MQTRKRYLHASTQMIEETTKKAKNVAVRVEWDLYRAVKRRLADSDDKLQSLIVKLLNDYASHGLVSTGTPTVRTITEDIPLQESNLGVTFMSLLENSPLNTKLEQILEVVNRLAHGQREENRTDQHKQNKQLAQLARLIAAQEKAGSLVGPPAKPGKAVRGRSARPIPPTRTGSD